MEAKIHFRFGSKMAGRTRSQTSWIFVNYGLENIAVRLKNNLFRPGNKTKLNVFDKAIKTK